MSHVCVEGKFLIVILIFDIALGIYGLRFYKSHLSDRKKRSSPLWGGRPADKECLDFCDFINCNNGECVLNPVNCRLTCSCNPGFTGTRCTDAEDKPRPKEGINTSNTDVISISLSISSTFSSSHGDEGVTLEKVHSKTTTMKPETAISRDLNDDARFVSPSGSISTVKDDDVPTTKLTSGLIRGMGIDVTPIQDVVTSSKPLLNPSTSSPTTTTEEEIREKESGWSPDIIQRNSMLSMDYHPKKTVKKPKPFQFEYYDDCKGNCTEGLCIPMQKSMSYHCLPNQHHCKNGFLCGRHGICDPEYINEKKYKCLCEPGWTGDTCRNRCELNCGSKGICVVFDVSQNVQKCACHKNYTGVRCEKLKPKPKGTYITILAMTPCQ